MYIFKNAFVSISRNKGRNILMGIIIFIIAAAATISLAIKNSADTVINSYESKNEIIATIGMNRENMMKSFTPGTGNMDANREKFAKMENLTKEEIEEYGDSEYIKSYFYTYNLNMNAKDLEKATSSNGNNNGPTMRAFDKNGKEVNVGDFSISAYSSYEAMNDFINGKYTISDGIVSDDFDSMSCVINEELATLNELSVGDTITLVDPNNSKLTYELTITGIYKENEDTSDSSNGMTMFTNSANTIITNNTVAEKIIAKSTDLNYQINPTYVLTSKDVIEDFSTEVSDKGLNEMRSVTTNLEEIESETASVKNISTYVMTFLIITLIIGGVVLFILNMINVRERKYEIGVLRTIGMKKSLVGSQFIIELVMVSLVALLIGFGVGSYASIPVANRMLANEINNQKNESENINNNFGGGPNFVTGGGGRMIIGRNAASTINQVDSIVAAVDIKVLAQLLAIGIVLTLVSSSAALINISKFSPLSILRERS